MSQYKAHNPNAEVLGAAILPIILGIGERAKPYLDRYGLSEIVAETWYSQQQFLNVFREIAEGESKMVDLVSIGMKIPESALLPPEITSVEGALMALDVAYKMNHRNDDSGWKIDPIGKGVIACISSTPYPAEFEYGVVYGFARRFRKDKEGFTVAYDDTAPNRAKGDDTTTYIVKLK